LIDLIDLRQGDVLDRLREIPEGSVHCVVTSPPYWGLRDTAKDRKRLSQRISDAATKRAGYDLPGRGGH